MKVNMDGMRMCLAKSYSKTVLGYRELVDDEHLASWPGLDELKEGLDELRQIIGTLMCTYSENPNELMSDMSDNADKLPYADEDDGDEAE